MLPRVDSLITVSAHAAGEIARLLPAPRGATSVIPYGVSRRFSCVSVEDARRQVRERFNLTSRYVLFVGALTPRKNVVRLVEAFSSLAARVTDVALVLAGPSGWSCPDLTDARAVLGRRLVLTGPLDDRDLVPLYRAASVVTLPSLSESFGLPIVEAMMSGVPVVASTATSIPEVAGDAAILVDPTDTEALAGALQSVLVDDSVARRLIGRGERRAAAFDWTAVAQQTVDVYRNAAARRSGSGARA
jgi:alpha-1,3-rhamnosyl/mannosyltransferase